MMMYPTDSPQPIVLIPVISFFWNEAEYQLEVTWNGPVGFITENFNACDVPTVPNIVNLVTFVSSGWLPWFYEFTPVDLQFLTTKSSLLHF